MGIAPSVGDKMWSDTDLHFMNEALAEAKIANDAAEIPVGAVVVMAGKIIGRGHNQSVELNDPSAHAEILALRAAGATAGNHRLTNATLFVTLEPCAMCAGALIQARVARVVFGAYDDRSGALGSVLNLGAERSLNHRFEVNGGCLKDDSTAILRSFFSERRG